jgi:hypothetical protein
MLAMTKAICNRIEAAIRKRLAFAKNVNVSVTDDPIARGYYVIRANPREYVSATVAKAILSAWDGIFLVRSQLDEHGAPELIFQSTRKREL